MQSEWKFVVYSWLFEGIFWKFWLHPACIPDIRSDFYNRFTQLLNIARDDVNPELNTPHSAVHSLTPNQHSEQENR